MGSDNEDFLKKFVQVTFQLNLGLATLQTGPHTYVHMHTHVMCMHGTTHT